MPLLTKRRPERERIERIKDVKRRLEAAKHELEVALRQGQYDAASRLRFARIPELEAQLPRAEADGDGAGAGAAGPETLLHERVTSADIARVVAKATGVPVQNLLKGERERLVHVCCPPSF